MSDEHIVSLQSSVQYLPTGLPVIVFQRVEEKFLPVREVMVCFVCLCSDKRIILLWVILWPKKTKYFLGILCYLSFSVVSDFEGNFLYL